MARAHREVDMMTRLRCPYVINFVGASFVPGKICLVTELCNSGSVADVIFSQRNFNYLLVLKVSLDMAKAISFLHTYARTALSSFSVCESHHTVPTLRVVYLVYLVCL
jgi:serine/threonine protein kinase